MAAPFTFLLAVYEGSNVSTYSPICVVILYVFFYDSHLSGCEILSCGNIKANVKTMKKVKISFYYYCEHNFDLMTPENVCGSHFLNGWSRILWNT